MVSSAVALGAVSGMRTFGAWAGLALRARVGDRRLRTGLLLAAAGEMAFDKSPWIPPRAQAPALAGRVLSGALAGGHVAGSSGARAGAAAAAATTYASERARALLGERLSLPDPALAVAEDALVLGIAAVAAAPAGNDTGSQAASRGGARPSTARATTTARTAGAKTAAARTAAAALRGLVAGAVGTAAMTSVQMAYLRATGGELSCTPGDVGRKLIDAPRGQRAAFNWAMHMLYGTAWGAPFGLLRSSQRGDGLLFGAAVWAVSLIELPLLDIAPVPWRQPPGALASDLAFHLVYGTATAAVLRD